MKTRILSGTALMLMFAAPLAAQEVHYGFSFTLDAPTDAFNNTTYSANSLSNYPTTVAYNSGAGVDFLIYQELSRAIALRYNVGFTTFTGTATSGGYYSLNTQDQMFSLGVAGQFFVGGGNAGRQSGTYVLAGAELDFENFDTSFGDPNYNPSSSVNKTRVAALAGVGHTFRSRWGGRYVLEGAYHRTLTNDNVNAGDQPPADFLKVSFGFLW